MAGVQGFPALELLAYSRRADVREEEVVGLFCHYYLYFEDLSKLLSAVVLLAAVEAGRRKGLMASLSSALQIMKMCRSKLRWLGSEYRI